ncbi:MAG: SusC/RagA family TonB-linked outer membrane protein [Bacteroidota bacterium]
MKYINILIISLLLFSVNGFAQSLTVKGKVTDPATGDPLTGVNVIEKGTVNGTITDIEGNYQISLKNAENAVLVYSFIGYITQEIDVNGQSVINPELSSDVLNLEEVVVTGLATNVKRSNLANAVSTVSSEKLTGTTSPQTLDKALYGKLTGANIVANSGAPGGGISIKLRGISTLGGGSSEPLYIIDGVYIDNSAISNGSNTATAASAGGSVISSTQDNPSNRIADLNPDDIASVEILKGASASAIYGARANAGVVIITTKKGSDGKTKISYSQDLGFASILNPLGTRAVSHDNAFDVGGAGAVEAFDNALVNNSLVNYEDELYGNVGFITRSNLSASGGDDKTKFFTSISYDDEDGIVDGTGFDRFSARLNVDHRVSKVFDFGVNANYIQSSAQRSITNNDNSGVSIGISLINTTPWDNLFPDADGIFPNGPSGSNFLQTVALSTVNEETDRFVLGGNLNINFFNKEDSYLQAKLQAGLDAYTTETTLFFPEILQFQQAGPTATNGLFSRGDNTIFNYNLSAFLVYGSKISDFDLTTSVGITRLDFNQNRTTTQAQNLVSGTSNLSQATNLSTFDAELESVDVGYVIQQELNYLDRIILTGGVRADQSTLIGDEDELFFFPKGSAAFNLHNFDFWNVPIIDKLKVRFAYGEAGGIPVPNLVTLNQPQFTGFAGSNISGSTGSLISNTLGDPNIEPERSREIETGFDLAAFDNKLSFTATYYRKTVDDLILTANQPTSSGFSFIQTNAGELRNEGVELSLTAIPIQNKNINWEVTTNWWFNNPEVTRLDVDPFTTGAFASFLGIFRIQEGQSPTEIVGPIPGSDGDVPLGDATPDFEWSIYNKVTFFQDFEFSMLWHWAEGQENIQLTNLLSDFGGTSPDFDADNDGNGVSNGDQRVGAFFAGNDASVFVEDASYVKLREISLYYTLPSAWVDSFSKGTIERIKVGVSGNNLVLFTDYTGYDPEVSNFGNNGVSVGVDVAPFPSSRRAFFHLKIDF